MNTLYQAGRFFIEHAAIILTLLTGLAALFFSFFLYPYLDRFVVKRTGGYLDWMQVHFDRMFIKVNKKTSLLLIASSTLTFGLLGFMLTFGKGILFWAGIASCLTLGWLFPRILLHFFWRRRLDRFNAQLVDALNLMANSIKSGLNLLQVIQVVVKEMPDPLSQEFGLVLNQHQLGVSLDDAIQNMLNRIPSDDLAMAGNAILILRETGGDLSETFDVIANTIRERQKVESKIKAVTAQGVTQSVILFILPLASALVLHVMQPGYLTPLYSTKTGYLIILAMLLFWVIGGFWLKKIITIDV